MRLIETEAAVLEELRSESDVIAEKAHQDVAVYTMRHPTLGRLVLVRLQDGSGLMIEVDE